VSAGGWRKIFVVTGCYGVKGGRLGCDAGGTSASMLEAGRLWRRRVMADRAGKNGWEQGRRTEQKENQCRILRN